MGSPARMAPTGEPARSKPAPHRLLIPIDATEASRRGVAHAIALARQAERVEVCLLYVVAPVRDWEVLRFRTEQEIHQHFQSRAERFLEDASAQLKAAGIPCKACFREQEPVFGILDLAEWLDAHPVDARVDFSGPEAVYLHGEEVRRRKLMLVGSAMTPSGAKPSARAPHLRCGSWQRLPSRAATRLKNS